MFRKTCLLAVLLVGGCSTTQESKEYRPKSSHEKAAAARADRTISPNDVRSNFYAYVDRELAWAGIIRNVEFKETERTIQVAFEIDHRGFDWMDHGGGTPFQLSVEGEGQFAAGWTVNKPARIDYLKSLAKPGYMILVYGKLYRMKDGVIQLAATSVRPIKSSDFKVVPVLPDS